MTRDPWMKFYPSDWRADPALRMCSLAARGLWIEMIGLMHASDRYGHLLVNGSPPNSTQLSVLAGAPSPQVPELLGELEAAGVFSRTKEGVIYSRRMTRDDKKRQTARKNGKMGGNPSLGKQRENPASDNPQDKDRDKTQKPEARSQSPPIAPQGAFAEFWAAYPKKVEKAGAERQFKAALKRGIPPDRIIAGAKRYAGSDTVQRGFVKNPTTWLNAGCWDDEELPISASSQLPTDFMAMARRA